MLATQIVLTGAVLWTGISILFCAVWAYARTRGSFSLQVKS